MCCTFMSGAQTQELLERPAVHVMDDVDSIDVIEKASLLEAASAFLGQEVEMENKYKIVDGRTGKDLYYAVEKTEFLSRQTKQCCGDCAPWEVDVVHTEGGSSEMAFTLTRPRTCTCCCCNRPTVTVRDARSGRTLGSLSDPCSCCCTTLDFEIRDAHGSQVATASSGNCQCGLCCPCPCGPCSRIHLDVEDKSGNKVGHLYRQIPGCCKWFFAPDVDNYHVEFGQGLQPSYKVLLMALALFMDFRYFNDNTWDAKKA